jgi:hypothetical protein
LFTVALSTSAERLQELSKNINVADDTSLLQVWQQALHRSPRGAPVFPTEYLPQQYEGLRTGSQGGFAGDELLMASQLPYSQPPLEQASGSWLTPGASLNQVSSEVALSSTNIDMADVQKDISELMELNKQLEQKVQDERAESANAAETKAARDAVLQQEQMQQRALQQQQMQQQQMQLQQRAVQQQQMQESSPTSEQPGLSHNVAAAPSAPVALHANEQASKQSEKRSKGGRSLLQRLEKAWRVLTGSSHVRARDRETSEQSEKEGETSGDTKYWWSPYAFYFVEGIIVVCCLCMCCIGQWNKFVQENNYLNQVQDYTGLDDEWIDVDIAEKWYCIPCVNTSTCVMQQMNPFDTKNFDLPVFLVIILYIGFMNFMWACFAGEGFDHYVDLCFLYLFGIFFAVGSAAAITYLLFDKIRDSLVDNSTLLKSMHQIDLLTTFFQDLYGKRFAKSIMKSAKFSKEDMKKMKKDMAAAGAYTHDTFDDITDFLGITEASSEDDVTAQDLMLEGVAKSSFLGSSAQQRAADKLERNKKARQAEHKKKLREERAAEAGNSSKVKQWKKGSKQPESQPSDGGSAGGGSCCRRSSSAPPARASNYDGGDGSQSVQLGTGSTSVRFPQSLNSPR